MGIKAVVQLRKTARRAAARFRVASKRKKWEAPKKDKGRTFDWSNANVHQRLKAVLNRHVNAKMLDALGMDSKQFDLVMLELRQRVAGTKATIDQLVGTFFEIAGSEHPEIHSVREELCDTNILSAMQALFRETEVFMTAAGDITEASKMKGLLENIQWKKGDDTAKQLLAEFDKKKIPKNRRILTEALETRLLRAVDPDSIRRVRDLMIGDEKYCDRAVLLKLANGSWLLLLSEEYKTPGSGGMSAQQSIRNNRLFNANVTADTVLSYIDAVDERQTLRLGDLLLNCDAVGNDQLGIKAARTQSVQSRILKVSKKIRERKKKYGEIVRTGAAANTIFLIYRLPFPSSLVRAMLTDAFAVMPK